MIITKLWGGLGNQMFEYAFGRRLAIKNQTEFRLDDRGLAHENDTPRRFSLGCFNIKAELATPTDIGKVRGELPGKFLKKVQKYLDKKRIIPAKNSYREVELSLPELLDLKGNMYLEGFFQKEDYFKDVAEEIRKDFTLKESLANFNPALEEKIKNCESVAIHVRHGDYISNPEYSKTHGALPLSYYQNAIDLIKTKIAKPSFFVFSDDKKWCEENLVLGEQIFFAEGKKDYEDLILMSYCKHQIVANSSFSWWGAWLNNNPEKIVIAPKQWFADEKWNEQTVNLIPKEWIRI
jgi:hypothetical protein